MKISNKGNKTTKIIIILLVLIIIAAGVALAVKIMDSKKEKEVL